MTRIRFTGFPENSAVGISAAQGPTVAAATTVSAWRRPAAASMVIHANFAPGTPAPALVWFRAEVTGDSGLPPRVDGDVTPDAEYGEYDQEFHELEFEWSFGDSGTWNNAGRLPAHLQQRDYAHGKVTAHVFSTPGEKTVTCTAYRMGVDQAGNLARQQVATQVISFGEGGDHPAIPTVEAAIPAGRRIYFSPDGDYSDAPAGANTGAGLDENSMYKVFQWAERRAPDPVAIFFKRGTVTDWISDKSPLLDNPNIYVGTYGSGERPVINAPVGGGLFSTRPSFYEGSDRGGYFILDGLECVGGWDPVTETGEPSGAAFGGEAVSHHLAHDCVFRNFGGPVVSFQLNSGQSLEIGERSMALCDCRIEGWRDYGVMIRGNSKRAFRQDFAVIGSVIAQPADAAHGINGKDGFNNAHGPLRAANVHHLILRSSDFFSRTHWDTKVQACLRLDMNSAQQWGETPGRTIVYGCVIEGGGTQVLSSGAGGTQNPGGAILCPTGYTGGTNGCRAHPWPKNTLIKHNLLLGAFHVQQSVIINKSCVSIIENVAILPDVPTWTANGESTRGRSWGFVMDEVTDVLGENGWVPGLNDSLVRSPVRVIGNLTIDLKATSSENDERRLDNVASVDSLFSGLVEDRDNTLWAPNYGVAPVLLTGPFEYVADVAPRETYGVRHDAAVNVSALTGFMTDNVAQNGIYDEDASFATPPDGLRLYRPAAGAGVANTATGPMSHRDFLGNVRNAGVRPAAGAIEPT